MIEEYSLLRIKEIIRVAYKGSPDLALYSEYDVLFGALQDIEAILEAYE